MTTPDKPKKQAYTTLRIDKDTLHSLEQGHIDYMAQSRQYLDRADYIRLVIEKGNRALLED
ncbi:hypothetical protein IH776_28295 [Escherichia coli]|nr:hypothetical protein [Escherichia coli]